VFRQRLIAPQPAERNPPAAGDRELKADPETMQRFDAERPRRAARRP
jgi:hypothetical protein